MITMPALKLKETKQGMSVDKNPFTYDWVEYFFYPNDNHKFKGGSGDVVFSHDPNNAFAIKIYRKCEKSMAIGIGSIPSRDVLLKPSLLI